jgi:hypothetical protein
MRKPILVLIVVSTLLALLVFFSVTVLKTDRHELEISTAKSEPAPLRDAGQIPESDIRQPATTFDATIEIAEHKNAASESAEPKIHVFGTVVDGATRLPVANALIGDPDEMFKDPATPPISATTNQQEEANTSVVRTDAAGQYKLDIPVELSYIACRAAGFAAQTKFVRNAVSGGEAEIDFVLRPGATISGHVVLSDTGEPVGGVPVLIEIYQNSRGFSGLDALPYATSGANGSFSLEDIPPGVIHVQTDPFRRGMVPAHNPTNLTLAAKDHIENLVLRVSRAGKINGIILDPSGVPMADAYVSASSETDDENGPPFYSIDSYAYSAGPTRADGAFTFSSIYFDVPYKISAYSDELLNAYSEVITLTPSHDVQDVTIQFPVGARVSGSVVQHDGSPLVDETVYIAKLTDAGTKSTMNYDGDYMRINTENDGSFVFNHIPDGQYRISARGPEIDIRVSESKWISDIRLVAKDSEKDYVSAPAFIPGLSIKGLVADANGNPVANATVETRLGQKPWGSVTSRDDGIFEIEAEGGRLYDVAAVAAQGETTLQNVAAGSEINLILSPPTKISGRVVDFDGNVVPNTRIALEAEASEASVPVADNAPSPFLVTPHFDEGCDEEGNFEIFGIVPGDYRVKAVAVSQGVTHSDVIRITKGESQNGIVVKFAKRVPCSGFVVNRKNVPISRASVHVYEMDNDPSRWLGFMSDFGSDSATVGVAETDEQGLFNIAGLTPGRYAIIISAAGFTTYLDNTFKVEDSNSNAYRAVMRKGGRIHGTVTNQGGNAPVATAYLKGIGSDGVSHQNSTTVDALGQFDFECVREGDYTVSLGGNRENDGEDDLLYRSRHLLVEDEQTSEVIVGGGVQLTGTIYAENPNRMKVVLLYADMQHLTADLLQRLSKRRIEPPNVAGRVLASGSGEFILEDVEPGGYIIEVYAADDESLRGYQQDPNRDRPAALMRESVVVARDPVTLDIEMPVSSSAAEN